MQARQIGQLFQPLEHAGHTRQIFLQIKAGRVEQEFVVLVRLHVFAVEVLIGLVVARAMPGPLQLLEVDRFQRIAGGDGQHRRCRRIGLEFEQGTLGDLLGLFVVVHQLPVADAAVSRKPEGRHEGGRHAVWLLERDAIHDALPARVDRRVWLRASGRKSAARSCGDPHPGLAQRHGVNGIGAEGVGAGVIAHGLVDLAAADHDLELVAHAGVLDRLDGLLHRVEGEREKTREADDVGLESC